MNPALVVVAFNRPASLSRLLASLAAAAVPGGTPLVISLDRDGSADNQAAYQAARSFSWPDGPKEVIWHEQRLGLVDHIYACGRLAGRFGTIVLLEDDLVVSPAFYPFALQAVARYGQDDRIAGISLNALWFNGFTLQPFTPWLDGNDVFFLQSPWYQGQVYTADAWSAFERWRAEAAQRAPIPGLLHESFAHFAADDWFPEMTRFLVETGRRYVFPRESLSTNFGDPGTHFARASRWFQVPLTTGRERYRLPPLDEALAVYDGFFELLPDRFQRLAPELAGVDFTADLHATRDPQRVATPLVLTSRSCQAAEARFGLSMRPIEANVVHRVPGRDLSLAPRAAVADDWLARLATEARLDAYYRRDQGLGRRRWLRGWLYRQLRRLNLAPY